MFTPIPPLSLAAQIVMKNGVRPSPLGNNWFERKIENHLTNTNEWFYKKMMPGGGWDYKVQPGYSPYNKEWTAYCKYDTEYRTSEWFGNYNYGLTGRFQFSLSVLKAGAGVAAGGADSPEDTAA